MTFYFDSEWLVQSQKTSIDVQAEVRNGALRNYSPLQELSSFVDRDELSRIDFPYLKGPFQIRGDTLIIPETQVNNSAINFWVNGWQNLETDAIEYSPSREKLKQRPWPMGCRGGDRESTLYEASCWM
jgi:hypothetical protein